MISISANLLRDVDWAAKRLKQDRNQVVRQALIEMLQKLKGQEFEALLAEGYHEMSEENATIVKESLPLQAAATEGVWKWDE